MCAFQRNHPPLLRSNFILQHHLPDLCHGLREGTTIEFYAL